MLILNTCILCPQHDTLGAGIRQAVFPEVLSALLSLCFCPEYTKHRLQDTALFRAELDSLTLTVDKSVTLRHFLLLMGLAQVRVDTPDGMTHTQIKDIDFLNLCVS